MQIKADVRLLTYSDGGRKGPMASGYRCDIRFANDENNAFGSCLHMEADELEPGGKATVTITPLFSQSFGNRAVGETFRMLEGNRVIGIGKIRNVTN